MMKAPGWSTILFVLLVPLALVGCKPIAPVQASPAQDKVQNAMSAAPQSISQDATILDWPTEAGGELATLRAGSNGWTCLPDDPASPTSDPMCLDQMWMVWLNAYLTGSKPQYTGVGFAYMLQGGSGASSSDPAATAPPPGEDWLIVPPHLMMVSPLPLDQALFPTEPASGGPWIAWAGTPYEHLIIPVADAGEAVPSAQFAHPEALALMEWGTDPAYPMAMGDRP